MKKLFYISFVILASMLTLVSCSDFLDEVKYTGTSYDYFETTEGFESSVIASYVSLRSVPTALEEVGSDIWQHGGDGAYLGLDSYNNEVNSSYWAISSAWDNNYSGISRVNTALSKIDEAPLSNSEYNTRKAELLFLRAYFYLDLVVNWGDVPLVVETVTAPKTDYHRIPQKEVWAQIITDLRQSYDLFSSFDVNMDEVGRATKGATGHLLAKAYLYRSSVASSEEDRGQVSTDLDSCIYYSTAVINSDKYELLDNYEDVFSAHNENNQEIIFSVQFSNDYVLNNGTSFANAGNYAHVYYTMYAEKFSGVKRDLITGRPWRFFRPTEYGIQIFDAINDARLQKAFVWTYYCNDLENAPTWTAENAPSPDLIGQKRFIEGDTAVLVTFFHTGLTSKEEIADYQNNSHKYYILPWEAWTNDYFPTLVKHLDPTMENVNQGFGTRNIIRMRLAETYLLVAEAYGRKGDFGLAANYINPVRERAGWEAGENKGTNWYIFYGGNFVDREADTKEAMKVTVADISGDFVNWIVDERGRELIGEMNRTFDLRRLGATFFVNRIKANNEFSAPNISAKHRFLPIPQTYIDLVDPPDPNPQNDGY